MKKTNKLLSIILTILTVISLMTVAASAFEADYNIELYEKITVKVPSFDEEEPVYVKFVPEETGKYVLTSYAENDIDPFCELYIEGSDDMLDSSDDENGLNFRLVYEFTAGETYYFALRVYADNSEEVDIALECGHAYSDGICSVCGNECDHTETADLGFCPCGDKYLGTDLADGDELEYDAAEHNNESAWYRFIPEESGVYCFESFSEIEASDPKCCVYDADGNIIKINDDINTEKVIYDFKLIYDFEAGTTYYFEVYNLYEDGKNGLKFSRATHTADDGSVHDLELIEETESTCIEHGYTEGLYCPDCDEYFYGHEEIELSEYHPDYDWDDICDDCGEAIVYGGNTDENRCFICDVITALSENCEFGNIFSILHNFLHFFIGLFA